MNKQENKQTMVAVPETALLALVKAKLKDTPVLFPEKLERAKAFISKVKMKTN